MSLKDNLEAELKKYFSGWNYVGEGGKETSCSELCRNAFYKAGVIDASANSSAMIWAGQGNHKGLDNCKNLERLSPNTPLKHLDCLWYDGHHTAFYFDGGMVEACPKSTHYLAQNGKSAVGFFPNYHNCSGGSLTWIYRIKEDEMTKIKASVLCERAIKCALGEYGATTYLNYYPANVGQWNGKRWSFDCLGLVHTLVNGFIGDKSVLGGGAVMDDFVLETTEDETLKSCTAYSRWNGTEPKKGSLVQSSPMTSSGHVGLYIGEYSVKRSNGTTDIYNVVECTPSWNNGVQLTWVDIKNGRRYNKKGGEYGSTWEYWGELGRVDYSEEGDVIPTTVLKKGSTGYLVKTLQTILNNKINAGLEVDGSFGDLTLKAVKDYQTKYGLQVDGYVGKETWTALYAEDEPGYVTLNAKEKCEVAAKVCAGDFGNDPRRKETLVKLYGTKVAQQIQDIVTLAFK